MSTDDQGSFIKVGVNDVEVGRPLQHPLYDGNRKLLLKRGYVVENAKQREILIERGLYRNLNERYVPPSVGGGPVMEEPAPPRETITTLEATKLRVGDQLLMQSSAEAPRLSVRLIGYLKNKGLIVTVPESDKEFVMLKDGQSFIFRFFSGENVYAFTTAVVKQTSVPFPHVHLSYPREVRAREIRKGSRVDVDLIAATLKQLADGSAQAGSGKLINVSTGGGALRAKTQLGERDDLINLKFKVMVGEIQSFIVTDAVIRTVIRNEDDPAMPFQHGLQFQEMDPNVSLALSAFVYQKIVDGT